MKLLHSKPFQRSLPPAILVVSLAVAYALTLAPGLTWANDGSDGGDLIAAAATGGVAHPTGYPLYLLLARLFQLLPFGSLAFRTNLMSALATVAAAVLVYGLVARSTTREDGSSSWPQGLAAGYAFGLAPLVWSQAVITEVYALQALLISLIFTLYTQATPVSIREAKRLDFWRGLLLGLALGDHITTALLAPLALLLGGIHRKVEADELSRAARHWFAGLGFDGRAFRRGLAWFGIGLCIYLVLPLRALANPPVNWGNPVTPGRFWWLVSGGVYQSYYLPQALTGTWTQVQALAALLLEQFGLPGIICGILGLVVFGKVSRLYLLTTWTALVFGLFAVLYRSNDSYVYLIPVCISFAIWIGIGISGIAGVFSKRSSTFGLVLGILMAGYFLVSAGPHSTQVDASKDMRAENFGHEVLAMAPENALVFARGDQAVFALWYFHFALQRRPDLTMIAADLLHFDWYQETLHATYPGLNLPGPFPWPETVTAANPSQPACNVQYTDQTEIECADPLDDPQ